MSDLEKATNMLTKASRILKGWNSMINRDGSEMVSARNVTAANTRLKNSVDKCLAEISPKSSGSNCNVGEPGCNCRTSLKSEKDLKNE